MLKIKIIKFLFVLLLLAFLIVNVYSRDKVAGGALTLEFINEVFAQEDEKIDFNKTILDITQKAHIDLLGEGFNTRKFDRKLKKMAKELSVLLKNEIGYERVINKLNNYIYEKQNFKVDRSKLFESNLESLLLNQVFETKKGYCLSLSIIYLCLAERLNLPLYGVMVPNHFFVRYVDGENKINIETTDKGANYDNIRYQHIYLKEFDDQVSLKKLTKKETIAIYLNNLANHYKLYGNHNKAMEIFKAVIKIIPNRASLYTNLGNTYERDNQITTAIMYYHKALSLNPYLCESHYNLGLAHYLYTRRFDDARRHGEVARKLGCRMHPEFREFLDKRK